MAPFPWLRLMEEDEEKKMENSKFLPVILDCQKEMLEYIFYNLIGHIKSLCIYKQEFRAK